jgi:hypothetical protein
MIAGIAKALPKVGPLRVINPKPPTAETQKMYVESLEVTVKDYRRMIHGAADQQLPLTDVDLDTGKATTPGEYRLADETYARLVRELALTKFSTADLGLRANILAYYGDANKPLATKESRCEWKEVSRDLVILKEQPSLTAQGQH